MEQRDRNDLININQRGVTQLKISSVLHLIISDCHEVHKSGGMKYEGDYYIMIKPEKSPKPFKVLCKVANGTG